MKKIIALVFTFFLAGLLAFFWFEQYGRAVWIDGIISHFFVRNDQQVFLVEGDGITQITTYDSTNKRWLPFSHLSIDSAIPFEEVIPETLAISPPSGQFTWTDGKGLLHRYSVYGDEYRTLPLPDEWNTFRLWTMDGDVLIYRREGDQFQVGRVNPSSATPEVVGILPERPLAGFQSGDDFTVVLEPSGEIFRIDEEGGISKLFSPERQFDPGFLQIQIWKNDSILLIGRDRYWVIDPSNESIEETELGDEVIHAWGEPEFGAGTIVFYLTPGSDGGFDLIAYVPGKARGYLLKQIPNSTAHSFWIGNDLSKLE